MKMGELSLLVVKMAASTIQATTNKFPSDKPRSIIFKDYPNPYPDDIEIVDIRLSEYGDSFNGTTNSSKFHVSVQGGKRAIPSSGLSDGYQEK